MAKARRKRAISVDELLRTKFKTIPLEGAFKKLIGIPEANGTWFIKGDSGNGKTSFMFQLAKELTKYGNVLYNSLEEGARKSMQDLYIEMNFEKLPKGSIEMLHREPMPEMIQRLKKHKSAHFVFIDSIQYTFMTLKEYKQMQAALPNKLLIFNSHVDGKQARGALAKSVEYDADVKIDVIGFRAFSRSRASRGIITEPYTIWHEGANEYWGDLL